MHWLRSLVSGIRALFNNHETEREMDEELHTFLDASTASKLLIGATPEEAARAARIEMGSTNAVKHHIRSATWESRFEILWQDFRYSARVLMKSPGFTAIAVLSLALGIGANAAIFSLIHQLLQQNLPVRDPEQLVTFGKSENGGILGGVDLGFFDMFPWSFARQMQMNPGPFQGIASYGSFSEKVTVQPPVSAAAIGPSAPALLMPASLVSGNYFSVLAAQPSMGRAINPADDGAANTGAVVVLSHHFWQQSLSSDPGIVGKTITVNHTPFEVIGVMPESFHGLKLELEPTAMWVPISMQPVILQHGSFITPDGPYFLHLFGRMRAQDAAGKNALANCQGWFDQQLRAAIRAREGASISPARQLEINHATVTLMSAERGVSLMRSQYGDSLKILMGVVALVLLIACANLANFLLARAATRQREIATRLALGSSRARIIRQSLIETLVLSVTGGLLGLGIAFGATRVLIAFVSQGSSYVALSSRPDLTVLLFTLLVSLGTGLLFGLAPAIATARTAPSSTLNAGARTAQSGGGKSSRFWPKALVTAQVMLSLLLLFGSGLFLRTFRNLQNQDYGFERSNLLLAQFNPKLAGYKPSQAPALNQRLIERLSALPGVRSAALSLTPPIGMSNWTATILLSGYTPAPKENMVSVLNRVSGKYFETAGISVIAGRAITTDDSASGLKVAVINQTLAQHFFPKGDAIGRILTIEINSVKGPWQIVGIVRDTKSGNPRDVEPVRMAYIPLSQIEPYQPEVGPSSGKSNTQALAVAPMREENEDRFARTILIRTTGDPAKTAASLTTAVAQIDPNLVLNNVITIHDQVSSLMTHDELIATLTSIFSMLALLLAAIGLYGVMSYNVVRRSNEIGIRIALGASSTGVQWMVLRESLILLAAGLILGIPAALSASRLVRAQLFQLSPFDPVLMVSAVLLIAVVTLLSAWLPAVRASRVDPLLALRCE